MPLWVGFLSAACYLLLDSFYPFRFINELAMIAFPMTGSIELESNCKTRTGLEKWEHNNDPLFILHLRIIFFKKKWLAEAVCPTFPSLTHVDFMLIAWVLDIWANLTSYGYTMLGSHKLIIQKRCGIHGQFRNILYRYHVSQGETQQDPSWLLTILYTTSRHWVESSRHIWNINGSWHQQ